MSKSSSELPIGEIKFYDKALPALADGDYKINISSEVALENVAEGPTSQDLIATTQYFSVKGPRFTYSSSDIHAMFPAPNSSGLYTTHLPYIVFNKRTAPWERLCEFETKDKDKLVKGRIPWLALLVLSEEELLSAHPQEELDSCYCITASVEKFLTPSSDYHVPNINIKSISSTEKDSQCHFIRLSKQTFQSVVPKLIELASLAHCRQINTGDKEFLGLKDEGWFSVLLTNRFPLAASAGEKSAVINVVHLVSIEGCEEFIESPEKFTAAGIQLISLASWSFNCLAEAKENFNQLAEHLTQEHQQNKANGLLKISFDDKVEIELPEEIKQRLGTGFVTPQDSTQDEEPFAWYRGPLTPIKIPTQPQENQKLFWRPFNFTYKFNDQPLDATYLAAFQIGRALALADSPFCQALVNYRHRMYKAADLEIVKENRWLSQLQQGFTVSQHDQTISPFKWLSHYLGERNLLSKIDQVITSKPQSHSFSTVPTSPTRVDAEEIKHSASSFTPFIQPKPKSQLLPTERLQMRISRLRKGLQRSAVSEAPLVRGTQPSPSLLAGENKDKSEELPIEVIDWIKNLRLFNKLPFYYLVADEKLLPQESIRFFYVDKNWLNAMTQGVLSIGLHTQYDAEYNKTIWQDLMKEDFWRKGPICGFLLRSSIVSGWPGLAIRSYENANDDSKLIKPLRQERLSSQVLLCLYDTIPQKVSLCEPQEQMSFGVSGDNLDTGFIELRSLVKGPKLVVGSTLGRQLELKEYYDKSTRVINIVKLQKDLPKLSPQQVPNAACFALQLVRAPLKLSFTISKHYQPILFTDKAKHRIASNELGINKNFPSIIGLRIEEAKETKPVETPSSLLTYQLSPHELILNSTTQLTLMITNNLEKSVYLSKIIIIFPAENLTWGDQIQSWDEAIKMAEDTEFKCDGGDSQSSNKYYVSAEDGQPHLFEANRSLTLTWPYLKVNNQPGRQEGPFGIKIIETCSTTKEEKVVNSVTLPFDQSTGDYKLSHFQAFKTDDEKPADSLFVRPGDSVVFTWQVSGLKETDNLTLSWVETTLEGEAKPWQVDVKDKFRYPPEDKVLSLYNLALNSQEIKFNLFATIQEASEKKYYPPKTCSITVLPIFLKFVADKQQVLLGDHSEVTLSWTACPLVTQCSIFDNQTKVNIKEKLVSLEKTQNYCFTHTPYKSTEYVLKPYQGDMPIITLANRFVLVKVYQHGCKTTFLTASPSISVIATNPSGELYAGVTEDNGLCSIYRAQSDYSISLLAGIGKPVALWMFNADSFYAVAYKAGKSLECYLYMVDPEKSVFINGPLEFNGCCFEQDSLQATLNLWITTDQCLQKIAIKFDQWPPNKCEIKDAEIKPITGLGPCAIKPNEPFLYALQTNTKNIHIFNTKTFEQVGELKLSVSAQSLMFSKNGLFLYLQLSEPSNTLLILSATTGKEIPGQGKIIFDKDIKAMAVAQGTTSEREYSDTEPRLLLHVATEHKIFDIGAHVIPADAQIGNNNQNRFFQKPSNVSFGEYKRKGASSSPPASPRYSPNFGFASSAITSTSHSFSSSSASETASSNSKVTTTSSLTYSS